MTAYFAFNEEQAIDYIKSNHLFFEKHDELTCYEFGDGNLNLVFRIQNTDGKSVILKQALPYARCVGESWPLTLDRARIEAGVLIKHGKVAPEHTAKVLHHDTELAVTVLEDLGHMKILRSELNQGHTFAHLAKHIATYLAKTSFYHSDFYLPPAEKKSLVSEFTNPELCAITEDLFFDDPYRNSERNNYPESLNEAVQQLQNHTRLKVSVAALKAKFFSQAQTLLHADVHTGSVFVSHNETKLIDPEFGFFGPIGFDLGSFIGNLLLNYCAQNARITEIPKRRDIHTYLLNTISTCLREFEQQWLALVEEEATDLALSEPGYREHFLQQVLQDAIGYCGTELIRRTIGLAHVSDIEEITCEDAKLRAQKQALQLGEQLILNASTCRDIDEVYRLLLSLLQ